MSCIPKYYQWWRKTQKKYPLQTSVPCSGCNAQRCTGKSEFLANCTFQVAFVLVAQQVRVIGKQDKMRGMDRNLSAIKDPEPFALFALRGAGGHCIINNLVELAGTYPPGVLFGYIIRGIDNIQNTLTAKG